MSHAVAAGDLGHVVEGVVRIGNVGKCVVIGVLACHLGGSAGVVILVGGLVTAAVDNLTVAGGVAVNRVGGLISACVGLLNIGCYPNRRLPYTHRRR